MIHSLRRLALTVPKLEVGADYYQTFGLNLAERAGGAALGFRCDGRQHDELLLIEAGDSRRLHHIGVGADDAGFAAIEARLKAANVDLLPKPAPDAPDGLWFHDPQGVLVNVERGAKHPDPQGTVVPEINRPGIRGRVAKKGCPTADLVSRPRRFGHMIIFAKDLQKQVDFYVDVLGMKLSDTIENGYAAFLRTADDSDHHVIGFIQSDAPGFHHASFEMDTIDHAELAAVRLAGKGYRHAWGPGRHGVGSNYFHYFRDPWNGLTEYFYDIDWIPGDVEWQPEDWTKKDGMFLWAADGMPPDDFGRNYEID